MTRLYVFYLSVCCCFFISCEVINPTEDEPAYIYIESFDFETEPEEGAARESITELWVYVNGKSVGIYDLPAHIPVLEYGDVDLDISAGIKNNGMSTARIIYPFYTLYQENVNLQPFKTDTIHPSFKYINDLNFFLESFEDPGIKFDAHPSSDTIITITNSEVLDGNGSGVVYLDSDKPYFLAQTDAELELPYGGYVFAELNFKSNNSFVVGLIAQNSSNTSRDFALVVNPSTQTGVPEWRKIYVDLGHLVTASPNADSFEFYIEASLDGGIETAQLYFDNIKIIHR